MTGRPGAPVDLREPWLTYCRQVVTDGAHREACATVGGSNPREGFASDVRWPGYLGPRYRPGGVMWVANIHRNFDSGGMGEGFAATAVGAVRAFAAGGDGHRFLDATAETYRAGLSAWTVGSWGRKASVLLGVRLDEIVYLNAARCQALDTGVALQRLCQRRWPLRSSVDLLRPRLLLTTSLTALTQAGPAPWPCRVVGFSQRNGRLVGASPWQPASGNRAAASWMPELARTDATER